MTTSITNEQARAILNTVRSDPQFIPTIDTILIADDQYPLTLDNLFSKLNNSTSLHKTMHLLRFNRKIDGANLQENVKQAMIKQQDKIRLMAQLNPTTDHPWDSNTFRRWTHFITNLCLSAVQDALKHDNNSKHLNYLFSPDDNSSKTGTQKSKNNIQGLLMYDPILVDSPWEAPDDLDERIETLISTRDPTLVAKAMAPDDEYDTYESTKAKSQITQLTVSIKQALARIYKLTSHTFHVLLLDVIPRARHDKSHLFSHIKGVRTDHILDLRKHNDGKRDKNLPELTPDQLKPHSAAHTLAFIKNNYVDEDDESAHYAWDAILKATRMPKTPIFKWVESFQFLTLRYAETIPKISKKKQIRINKAIMKQVTDDEKRTITSLDNNYTILSLQNGDYQYDHLSNLLAQNTSSFTVLYKPSEQQRIVRFLKTRQRKEILIPDPLTTKTLNNTNNIVPKRKLKPQIQRAWTYLQHSSPQHKRFKGKGSDNHKGHKGKGKFKSNNNRYFKGKPRQKGKTLLNFNSTLSSSPDANNAKGKGPNITPNPHAAIRCHFCHKIGHIKANCRKHIALQKSPKYTERYNHGKHFQLIYDHLEDSVLAPIPCLICEDTTCDGTECLSTFNPDDYNEAATFFTAKLSSLVANAKLEHPLESQSPQTTLLCSNSDDWGEEHTDIQPHAFEQDYNNEQTAWDIDNEDETYLTQPLTTLTTSTSDKQIDSDSYEEDDQDEYGE